MNLSDDILVGNDVPAKVIKAMAVIGTQLHQTFDVQPWIERVGKSKESCILCSLAVRDFMRAIGFEAKVVTVCAVLQALRGEKLLHSAGIGVPAPINTRPGYWNGHMVCVLPREKVLIDTTLFQVKRPAWPHLPGIVAVKLADDPNPIVAFGMTAIGGLCIEDDEDYQFTLLWLDRPQNNWRKNDGRDKRRRQPAVAAMTKAFGTWRDNDGN